MGCGHTECGLGATCPAAVRLPVLALKKLQSLLGCCMP